MSTVAIIPARGGSKRLPRKNILDLAGKPMLAYSIEVVQRSGVFDEVYVSTEDQQIADVARRYGAEVIQRPSSIAEDRSTVAQVCIHALEHLPSIEVFCCVYATAVLLKPESISSAKLLLDSPSAVDFVMGVSQYEHPPVQALVEGADGLLAYMWPEWKGVQSQFYPRLVVSNGTFYWARKDPMLREGTFYGERLRGFVVPPDEVSDIDDLKDFERVRKMLCSRVR